MRTTLLIICLMCMAGCKSHGTAHEQPLPATVQEAQLDIVDLLTFHTFLVQDARVSETELLWKEQLHDPAMRWVDRALVFSDVTAVEPPRETVSGWTVRLTTALGGAAFELETPEHAGRLHAALRKLTGKR